MLKRFSRFFLLIQKQNYAEKCANNLDTKKPVETTSGNIVLGSTGMLAVARWMARKRGADLLFGSARQYSTLDCRNKAPSKGDQISHAASIQSTAAPPNTTLYHSAKVICTGFDSQVIDKGMIYAMFSKYGNMHSFRILKEKDAALIYYKSEEAAREAIEGLNGSRIEGERITVAYVPKRNQEDSEIVCVKGIGESVSEDLLKSAFEAHGKVSKISFLRNQDGTIRNVAFVEFEDARSAKEAIVKLNQKTIKGLHRLISVEKAMRGRDEGGAKVFIGNVSSSVDENQLRMLLMPYGSLQDLFYGRRRRRRRDDEDLCGHAFAKYSCWEEASFAINELDGKKIAHRALRLLPYNKTLSRKNANSNKRKRHSEKRPAYTVDQPMHPWMLANVPASRSNANSAPCKAASIQSAVGGAGKRTQRSQRWAQGACAPTAFKAPPQALSKRERAGKSLHHQSHCPSPNSESLADFLSSAK